MPEKYSRAVPGGRAYWLTQRLWDLVADLPTQLVPITAIAELDQGCWFGNKPATCRAVAEHARRILAADLSHPIILSSDGRLMDGGHRLARAWMEGLEHLPAVQFSDDPEPDYVIR